MEDREEATRSYKHDNFPIKFSELVIEFSSTGSRKTFGLQDGARYETEASLTNNVDIILIPWKSAAAVREGMLDQIRADVTVSTRCVWSASDSCFMDFINLIEYRGVESIQSHPRRNLNCRFPDESFQENFI